MKLVEIITLGYGGGFRVMVPTDNISYISPSRLYLRDGKELQLGGDKGINGYDWAIEQLNGIDDELKPRDKPFKPDLKKLKKLAKEIQPSVNASERIYTQERK